VGTDMAIIRLPVTDLSSDPANMRTHPEANILAIVASLRRWGQQKPIVIDASHVVRCGNGTLEAARRLGLETIDCIVSDLTGAELTAFAIADNRTAELAEWSAELAGVLEALAVDLPDLDLGGLGFATPAGSAEAEAKDATAALAEQIAAEAEYVAQYNRDEEKAAKLQCRIGAIRKAPGRLAAARCVVLSADSPDCLIIADESLADFITELRRYAEAGEPSPLAAVLATVHRL
jgi:ParB-like chromosome segregation protein Spo0J